MDLSPDLSPFLLDLDLDLGSKDSDLDLDLEALPASPFFKSFVLTRSIALNRLLRCGPVNRCKNDANTPFVFSFSGW